MFRLKMLGCLTASFDCLERVITELPDSDVLDYFAETSGIVFLPFHPALEVIDKEVELIKDGNEIIGAKIKIIATDGSNEYVFKTSCLKNTTGELVCYPSPEARKS